MAAIEGPFCLSMTNDEGSWSCHFSINKKEEVELRSATKIAAWDSVHTVQKRCLRK